MGHDMRTNPRPRQMGHTTFSTAASRACEGCEEQAQGHVSALFRSVQEGIPVYSKWLKDLDLRVRKNTWTIPVVTWCQVMPDVITISQICSDSRKHVVGMDLMCWRMFSTLLLSSRSEDVTALMLSLHSFSALLVYVFMFIIYIYILDTQIS